VLELFRRLHTGGQTILLVTHDGDVAAPADRVVSMRDGRVVDGDGGRVGATQHETRS
jgi:putative ABC transport system ATP-binding protein